MQGVSVSLYAMRVTERRKSDLLKLDSFDGSSDLLDVISEALKEHQGNSVEIKGGTRRTYITNDLKRADRVLDGHVEVGDSGYTASIKNVQTSKEEFKQRPTHAAMIPLYVRFWVPTGQTFALAAFQHFGDTGCKSSMNSILLGRFHQRYPDYTFALRQVLPSGYAQEVLKKGAIKELRFIQHGVGKDLADIYGGSALPPGVANFEMRVVARKNNKLDWTDWISKAVQGSPKVRKGMLELDSFECNDFRIRVNINGKDRVLKVHDLIRLNSRIDVTNEIVRGRDGHPRRDSISEVCEGLMAQVAKDNPGIAV